MGSATTLSPGAPLGRPTKRIGAVGRSRHPLFCARWCRASRVTLAVLPTAVLSDRLTKHRAADIEGKTTSIASIR